MTTPEKTMTADERIGVAEMQARIALATAAAIFVAGLLLVTVILPAEYGVDPAGTGTLFGLTAIAEAAGPQQAAAGTTEVARPEANTLATIPLKEDTRTFALEPGEGFEFKYQMDRGAAFVYSWTATGRVESEFHGEPVGAPRGYADTYHKDEGLSAAGSFFAPTTGIHGWYWKNLTGEPITVTLTSAGFYASGVEFRKSGRTEHTVKVR